MDSVPNRNRTIQCQNPNCQHRGRTWEISPTMPQDALITWPTHHCLGCGTQPTTISAAEWGILG